METWVYFALFFSHAIVGWLFYRKGLSDAVAQMSYEQEMMNQQNTWQQLISQFRGGNDDEEE